MTPPEHESYTPAQVLVLERLTRIETLLTVFTETQEKTNKELDQARAIAEEAKTKAASASDKIAELQDSQKWSTRFIIGLIGAAIVNFVVNALQSI